MADTRRIATTVMKRYGRTYAEEAGIHPEKNTPSALFQLLYLSLMLSARIAARNAVEAASALRKAGLTTAQKMAGASWQARVDVITWHGYKRYDESTSTMLGQTAELALERYKGDLRRLREAAGRDVARERALLQEFKGIGKVGADIFLREVQGVWDEAYPYADRKVLDAASKLDLPTEPDRLARLVSKADFPRFTAGLIRTALAKDYDEVRAAAAG